MIDAIESRRVWGIYPQEFPGASAFEIEPDLSACLQGMMFNFCDLADRLMAEKGSTSPVRVIIGGLQRPANTGGMEDQFLFFDHDLQCSPGAFFVKLSGFGTVRVNFLRADKIGLARLNGKTWEQVRGGQSVLNFLEGLATCNTRLSLYLRPLSDPQRSRGYLVDLAHQRIPLEPANGQLNLG